MAWRRSGDKPLSEPMMAILLTHIYALFGLKELKESTYDQEIILYLLKCEEYCVTWIRLRIDLSNSTHPDQIYIPTTCNQ